MSSWRCSVNFPHLCVSDGLLKVASLSSSSGISGAAFLESGGEDCSHPGSPGLLGTTCAGGWLWTLCEESRPAPWLTKKPQDPGGCVSGVCGAGRMPGGGSGAGSVFSSWGGGARLLQEPLIPLPSLSSSCSGLCFLMAQMLSCLWASDSPCGFCGSRIRGAAWPGSSELQGLP